MTFSIVLNPMNFLKVSAQSKKALKILGFVSISSLFVLSIFQINSYTQEVYKIRSHESKISSLAKENKILEIKLSQNNTFNNIGNHISDFVKAGKIEYIQVMEPKVASQIR